MTPFDQAFAIVLGEEGSYDTNPDDRGNWTGGAVGRGTLAGTKYGISAAEYPDLDIKNLTLEAAKVIYRSDYWDVVCGDALPPALALLVFDAAVNNGVDRAARWLQLAVGVEQDGLIGPITLGAVSAMSVQTAAIVFMARIISWDAILTGREMLAGRRAWPSCHTWHSR